MPFRKDSKGIAALQKNSKTKSTITETDIKKMQKILKDRLSKQIKDITTNYKQFLSNDTKTRAGFEKTYETTKKLQARVIDRIIKAVDDKNREIQKHPTDTNLGRIGDKLDELKEFTLEIKPTIKSIHKHYKTDSIKRMDMLKDEIKKQIEERIQNIKLTFNQFDSTLKELLKNSSAVTAENYTGLYEMMNSFPDYGTSIKQAYTQGGIYVTKNIEKFTKKDADETPYNEQAFNSSNNPTAQSIAAACQESSKAVNKVSQQMQKIQQKANNVANGVASTPPFLILYIDKIKDPLLKMTFVFGAEQALIDSITQYMNDAQRDLKEYEQTTSQLHTTAKDIAKKVGIGFLRLIPAIIGVATGLGSTLGIITDLVESLGWFINAIAYGLSDTAGILSEEDQATLDQIMLDYNKTSSDLFKSAGVTAEKNGNDNV